MKFRGTVLAVLFLIVFAPMSAVAVVAVAADSEEK